MGQFSDLVTKFYADYEVTLAKDNEDAYVRFSQIIDALSDSMREYAQEITAGDIRSLANKLKGSAALTSSEVAMLRQWIVGDAASYIKVEDDVENWKSELKHLMVQIAGFTADKPSVDEVFRLQALMRDADRLVDDLCFYNSQKDRVQKFDSAVQNLTQEDRDMLCELLTTKLSSKYY